MLKMSVFATYFLLALTSVSAQTPFYQGKTVTILHGRAPGGSGDFRVRAVLPFLQKYIPAAAIRRGIVIEHAGRLRRIVTG